MFSSRRSSFRVPGMGTIHGSTLSAPSVHLRRKRFAFAVAPRWKGASIDAAEAPLRSANPDKQKACCFSNAILANSVGEHLPCASIQLLRATVSNEDNINSVIIAGSQTGCRYLVCLIKRNRSIRVVFASRRRRGCSRCVGARAPVEF